MAVTCNEVNIYVKDLEAAKRFYKDVFGLEPYKEHVSLEGTPAVCREAIYKLGEDFDLTLLTPIGPESVLANRFLEKRGEGINHFRLVVDDMETLLEKCKAGGVQTIGQAGGEMQPGDKIGFIAPRSAFGCLLEIAERRFLEEYWASLKE